MKTPLSIILFLILFIVLYNFGKSAGHTADKKGKILVLADGLGTHYSFALNMVNILSENGYDVHLYAVKYGPEDLKKPKKAKNFVQIPFPHDKEYEKYFDNMSVIKVVKELSFWGKALNYHRLQELFIQMLRYNLLSFYKAVIEYKEGNIIEQLRNEKFDLGISEFCISFGAFAVFHKIGLQKYIATSAAPAIPAIDYLLGLPINADVPDYVTAKPGDGNNDSRIRTPNSKRRIANIDEYKKAIPEYAKLFTSEYKTIYDFITERKSNKEESKDDEGLPPLDQLLRKARYFLINQHPLARFPFITDQQQMDRVKFIGGLDVEAVGQIGQKFGKKRGKKVELGKEYEWLRKEKCVVVFSLGTMVQYDGFTQEYASAMIDAMSKHKECQFLVRISEQIAEMIEQSDKKHLVIDIKKKSETPKAKNQNHPNIMLVKDSQRIPQQQILALPNIRGFIHHCGQNTLNEVIYAGVPFICIPFFGDQFYNIAVGEFIGSGIWVEHPKFEEKFPEALDLLLKNVNAKGVGGFMEKVGRMTSKLLSKGRAKVQQQGGVMENGKNYAKVAKELALVIHKKHQKQMDQFLEIIGKAMAEQVNAKTEPIFHMVGPKMVKVDEGTHIPTFAEVLQKAAVAGGKKKH